jgi:hypothetical protein
MDIRARFPRWQGHLLTEPLEKERRYSLTLPEDGVFDVVRVDEIRINQDDKVFKCVLAVTELSERENGIPLSLPQDGVKRVLQ